METLRLIVGSKAFATIAGGSLLMILGAALGVAIGSDSSSNAATSLRTITKDGTTRIVAVSAKPKTVNHKIKVTVTKRKTKTVTGSGSTSIKTVTGPARTVTVTRTRTTTVPTTVTTTITVTTSARTGPSGQAGPHQSGGGGAVDPALAAGSH